ncbi:MAG: hypothetical protein H5T83_10965, partial [Actinotalea sp.]|nr:hypothetical protein [Actinotalea sp.]
MGVERGGLGTTLVRVVAVCALAVVAWALVTAGGAVRHGHPAYAVVLTLTAAVAGVVLARSVRPARPRRRRPTTRWRRIRFALAVVGAVIWVAVVAWLRPFPAVEPALAAMASDDVVAVEQSSTRI